MKPFLSVIMPVYNGEQFIASALESIRAQQLEKDELEVLVVDDGSSDRTGNIVSDFIRFLPIRLLTPGRMGNWVIASNLGLHEAKGEWVCFLHQDDVWLPGRIARLRPALKSARGALILHNAKFIGPDGQDLGSWTCPLREGVVSCTDFLEHLLVQNFIAMPSPVFRRKAAVESGCMDKDLWYSADWDLWLRLGAAGPIHFIPEVLAAFRVHPSSQTAARRLHGNEWEYQLNTVLNRHLPNFARTGAKTGALERAARASIAVNSALSAASRDDAVDAWAVLLRLLALGPLGWRRYLRDSRIGQRVGSRLKLQKASAGGGRRGVVASTQANNTGLLRTD